MFEMFRDHPAWLYVVATGLPLLSATLILMAGAAKNLTRPVAASGGIAAWMYKLLGGNRPQAWGAYLSVGCVALSACICVFGLVSKHDPNKALAMGYPEGTPEAEMPSYGLLDIPGWYEQVEWLRIGSTVADDDRGQVLTIECYAGQLVKTMCAMVTVIATLIFVYSLGYMRAELGVAVTDDEAGVRRRGRFGLFFVYLSLFVAAMLNLLLGYNLLQIFFSWELMGVCSFLLIGFYHERRTSCVAATKAFIVNRAGDIGFMIAMAACWSEYGTLHVYWNLPAGGFDLLMGLGLFAGCVGKSAQVPLHVWLPDAMAGPTPVSALIHAATMVAAGVYLAARCVDLYSPEVQLVIAYTGAVTLLVAGIAACVQTDIKKVLAYSTCSQLGFMMLAVGVDDATAAYFHLWTHAYFKALLFLCAGSVILGLHHEQDIRRMGGLRRRMPVTAYTMLVGTLAIGGFPLLSGWYSKGAIMGAAWDFTLLQPRHAFLFAAPFITAGLTAYYMVRLWLLVFAGVPRHPESHEQAHESPKLMTVPLIILAGLSVVVGWGWPIWDTNASLFLQVFNIFDQAARTDLAHVLLEVAVGVASVTGFGVAYFLYHIRGVVPAEPRGLRSFFAHAWYFDALYRRVIVRPVVCLAFALAAADKRPGAADGHGSDPAAVRPDPGTLDGWLSGIGLLTAAAGRGVRRAQLGYVRGYVLALGLTVVGLLGMLAVLNR